jgi:hypothetical protein
MFNSEAIGIESTSDIVCQTWFNRRTLSFAGGRQPHEFQSHTVGKRSAASRWHSSGELPRCQIRPSRH